LDRKRRIGPDIVEQTPEADMKLYTLCGAETELRFSPHSWKAVMALAHKGFDFDEAPTAFTKIPHLEGGFSPTVPVLRDGDTLVRDSFDIALYLDDAYPDRPSLFKGEGGRALSRAVEGFSQSVIHPALMRIILVEIHDCLAPEDQHYFRTDREAKLGKNLEDVISSRETEIATFPAKLEPIRHLLKFQKWFGGESPLFADYIVFGALQWARVTSGADILKAGDAVHDWFERCLDLYGGIGRQAPTAQMTLV
jgi:glutathione S-transferase